jgi:hypothetical protein
VTNREIADALEKLYRRLQDTHSLTEYLEPLRIVRTRYGNLATLEESFSSSPQLINIPAPTPPLPRFIRLTNVMGQVHIVPVSTIAGISTRVPGPVAANRSMEKATYVVDCRNYGSYYLDTPTGEALIALLQVVDAK